MGADPPWAPFFVAAWLGLAVATAVVLLGSWDAATKRRWARRLVVAGGVGFVAFTVLSGLPLGALAVVVPVVVAMSWLNLRTATVFCERCGRRVHWMNPFRQPRFCPHCGAPLPV